MNRAWRHIKEGFLGAFRHGALFFSSVSSVTITLVLMSVFILLNANLNQITLRVENSVSLHVQIDNELSTEEGIPALQKELEGLPDVASVKFSDKERELDLFIASFGEEGEELYGGYRGESNPMMNAFEVNVKSGDKIRDVENEIREIEGVVRIKFGGDTTVEFLHVLESIRNIGFIFVFVLGGIAVFLISNTIAATVHSRQREISIMRTVGATNWFIRWPFIVEGMIIGFIGSVIPILITVFGYQALYASQASSGAGSLLQFVPANPLVGQTSLIILLVGMGVGAIGSLFTVSRRLRWTR